MIAQNRLIAPVPSSRRGRASRSQPPGQAPRKSWRRPRRLADGRSRDQRGRGPSPPPPGPIAVDCWRERGRRASFIADRWRNQRGASAPRNRKREDRIAVPSHDALRRKGGRSRSGGLRLLLGRAPTTAACRSRRAARRGGRFLRSPRDRDQQDAIRRRDECDPLTGAPSHAVAHNFRDRDLVGRRKLRHGCIFTFSIPSPQTHLTAPVPSSRRERARRSELPARAQRKSWPSRRQPADAHSRG